MLTKKCKLQCNGNRNCKKEKAEVLTKKYKLQCDGYRNCKKEKVEV